MVNNSSVMKHIFNYLLVLLILSACKVENKNKTDLLAASKESSNPKTEATIQQKDTVREKSAIGKSYKNYLNEIVEFRGYHGNGWHSISDQDDTDSEYSNYGLKSLDIYEENKEEGTSKYKADKYVVMVNNKVVIDYIDVEKIDIPKGYVLCDEVWLNNEIDREIFAYVRYDDSGEQFVTDIHKAFRADKETGKIFEIPLSKDMKVENADYGF